MLCVCLFQRLKASLCCSCTNPGTLGPSFLHLLAVVVAWRGGVQRGAERVGKRESLASLGGPGSSPFWSCPASLWIVLYSIPPPVLCSPLSFGHSCSFLLSYWSGEGKVLKPFIICLLPSPCCWQTLLVSRVPPTLTLHNQAFQSSGM